MTPARWSLQAVGAVALAVCICDKAVAQPPIQGVTGTVGREESQAVYAMAAEAIDGIRELGHLATAAFSHPPKVPEGLKRLNEGTTVVLRRAIMNETEGVVTRVDRQRREITVLFENRSKEQLRILDTQPSGVGEGEFHGDGPHDSMTLYYRDEVGHYFILHAERP